MGVGAAGGGAIVSEHTEEEKREAFAAWDAYKPRFVKSIESIVRIPGAGRTLLDNPLVMLVYADAYLAGKRAAMAAPTPTCEHEGCTNPGEPCWLPDDPQDAPSCHYCAEHMYDEGFCPGCRLFWSGVETFDFSPLKRCDNCASQVEDEDELGDEWVEYPPDMDWEEAVPL